MVYIRIYDEEVKLLDSWDFRYAPWLDHILVDDEGHSSETLIVPLVNGHATTRIGFVNTGDNNAFLKLRDENSLISVNDNGMVEIEPHPAGDFMRCTLAESRGEVDIDIAVPRIWWRIGDGKSGGWDDKPLTMTHKEFYNRRRETVEILLPIGIKKVYAGFNDNTKEPFIPHRYASYAGCAKVGFRISKFANDVAIAKPSSEKIELRIKCRTKLFSIIHIPGKVKKRNRCRRNKRLDVRAAKSTVNQARESGVKNRKKYRRNKRFSVAEICAAELTVDRARELGIRIDKRRETLYHANIAYIKKIGKTGGDDHADLGRN